MGKTFPTECPHGRILDWGDVGDPDNPETAVEHCDECQDEPDELAVHDDRLPEIAVMDQVLTAFQTLDPDAQCRALRWLTERLTSDIEREDEEAPTDG